MLLALSSIKILGIILAGAFSVLGLLPDFKDKNTQKITRYGKIALILDWAYHGSDPEKWSNLLSAKRSGATDVRARTEAVIDMLSRVRRS